MTENISIAIIACRSNFETAQAIQQVFLNINPDFQRNYECWDMKLKVRLVESVLLQRTINPIWTIRNAEEQSDEVLDGMHRLQTVLDFLGNKFPLHEKYLMELTDYPFKNKNFKEFSFDEQGKFRNYTFHFNKLDSSYREDSEKLQAMYEILNRSSTPLNDFEYHKPIRGPLYEFLKPFVPSFLCSPIYPKETSERGAVETNILKALALCEDVILTSNFKSITSYTSDFICKTFGETREELVVKLREKEASVRDTFSRMFKYIQKFKDERLLGEKPDTKTQNIPLIFVICRCTALIKNEAVFSRHCSSLVGTFKNDVLVDDIQTKLRCESRSTKFYLKLISVINEIIQKEIDFDEPRCFPKKIIQKKLEEQKRDCALCSKPIEDGQKYEGDHIKAWVSGGKTTEDNLQVVHAGCHKRKEQSNIT